MDILTLIFFIWVLWRIEELHKINHKTSKSTK